MVTPDRSSPRLILFALWLMVFSASSQVIIVSPILPRISEALAIPAALQGTLVSSYAVLLSLFALITGPISDKFGRRRILLIGTASMSVALYLHGVADSYLALLIMRGAAGAAGGMLSGAAVAYVGDYFPYERRGWANGWVMSGLAFGQIAGIPLGTLLANLANFRWAFLMFAFTMTAAFLLIWFFVPQPRVALDRSRLTIRGVLVRYGRLLREGPVTAAVFTYLLMFMSLGLYVIYLPTWLEQVVGVSGEQIALLFFFGGLVSVLASPTAGHLSDTLGRKPLIVTSCLGLGVIMLLTTYVIASFWTACILFALAMLMFSLRLSPLQSLMTALVSGERRGMLMALAIAIGQIGVGLGGGLAGPAYTEFGYVSNTLIGAVLILLMALVVYQFLPEPGPDADASSAEHVEVRPAPSS